MNISVMNFGIILWLVIFKGLISLDKINPTLFNNHNIDFNESPFDRFPNNLEINLYLTHMKGFLFYGVDQDQNQLIVIFNNSSYLSVEYNGLVNFLYLNDFCECKYCKFRPLQLRFELLNKLGRLMIQCNKHQPKDIQLLFIDHNKDYYIPKSKDAKHAYMWIISKKWEINNTDNKIENLAGCVSVKYSGLLVNMDKYNLTKCKENCSPELCNQGECIETYETIFPGPICNCTKSFDNGKYCNSTYRSMNKFTISSFEFLKFSVQIDSKNIFNISIGNISMKIYASNDFLLLGYETLFVNNFTSVRISKLYNANQKYVIIINFQVSKLFIQVININNNEQFQSEINIDYNLLPNNVTIDLLNNNVQFAYKTINAIEWLYLDNIIHISNNNTSILSKNNSNNYTKIHWLISIIIIIIIIGSIIIVIKKMKRPSLYRNNANYTNVNQTEQSQIV